MNNNSGKFSISSRLKSVQHALDGIAVLLKEQHNAWIHLISTGVVVSVGILFHINKIEWLFLVIAILLVWVCETFNTAIEYLCDVVSPEYHPLVKKSKDVAAAGVLISAFGAIIIGTIIFFPYFKTI